MSINSDKLAYVEVIINCRYSVAQMQVKIRLPVMKNV